MVRQLFQANKKKTQKWKIDISVSKLYTNAFYLIICFHSLFDTFHCRWRCADRVNESIVIMYRCLTPLHKRRETEIELSDWKERKKVFGVIFMWIQVIQVQGKRNQMAAVSNWSNMFVVLPFLNYVNESADFLRLQDAIISCCRSI